MRTFTLALALAAGLTATLPARAQFQDARVQAPKLSAPERGSIVGPLSHVAFGAADLGRGAFSLPSPMALATERGQPGASFLPTYSPEAGQTEWGLGWQTSLSLTRWRASGDVKFDAGDGLVGPWGTMVRGSDGAFYPDGLRAQVRVEVSGDTYVAYLADGTTWTFGRVTRDVSSRGTYVWYLDEVVLPTGQTTQFSYSGNASGRIFLASVAYGTVAGKAQHRVRLTYAPVASPVVDYRCGDARVLDQRVTTVTVETVSATTGLFAERWRYALGYREEGLGPSFFLASAQRTFASGESEPATTYTYARSVDRIPTVAARRVPKLDAVLTQLGTAFLSGKKSAILDADLDGRPDLEAASDNALWMQTDDGFTSVALTPLPADADPRCRAAPSALRSPRTLVSMRDGDDASYVVSTTNPVSYAQTAIALCSREGKTLFSTTVDGQFRLGSTIRLADLNRDHQPDFIRLDAGAYVVLPNTSTPSGFSLGAPIRGTLSPVVPADLLVVHDMNGDGLADIVAESDGGVRVWYGRGNFSFTPTGTYLGARTKLGGTIVGLKSANVSFADINKDGLADMLVGSGSTATLYVNTGTALQQTSAPALAQVNTTTSSAAFVDLAGSGETEVFFASPSGAFSVALTDATLGLMTTADDGRGTVLHFDYARAPASPGARQRPSVLTSLRAESTGTDAAVYEYSYAEPRLHSTGHFLVGFDRVARRAPLTTDTLTFANDDHSAGVLLSSATHDDLAPGLERVAFHTYDDVAVHGVPWKRPKSVGEGWTSTDPTHPAVLLDQTDYLVYAKDVCPTASRRMSRSGALLTESQLASIPKLAKGLGCLPERTVVSGQHADAALDFRYDAAFDRNDVGLITRITHFDPAGASLIDQEVTYTADGKPFVLGSPGRGTTLVDYNTATGELQRLTSPEGVVTEVAERDAVTDGIRAFTTRHGSLAATAQYRFDGRERLWKMWSDVGHSSEARPEASYTYREAEGARLALIRVASLIDGTAGIFSEAAELFAADGQSLAKASRIPEGWALAGVTSRTRATRETRGYRVKPVADITTVNSASLFAGASLVAHGQALVLGGGTATSSELLHVGVERVVTSSLTLDTDLTRADVENGAYTTRTASDPSGRVVAVTDAGGARTGFTYDALGRLRSVRLADGATHKVAFDGMGRTSRIDRSGIGALVYAYSLGTGLLASTTYLGTDGVEARKIAYQYDGIGRVTVETSTEPKSGRPQSFTRYYDGATPEAPSARGLTGLLTAITGDQYAKHPSYRADGKITSTKLDIAGWRGVEDTVTYNDDGSVRGTTRVVRDRTGAELYRTAAATTLDTYGRKIGETLDGAAFSTYAYDVEGLPAWVQFAQSDAAHGEIATFQRDALTRAQVGLNLHGATWSAATNQRWNARGFVGSEDVLLGTSKRHRTYAYSPQGFLASSADEADSYAYTYDATGLPARTTSTVAGAVEDRTFARSGATLTAGTHHHTFDTLGRAIERDDVRLTYGPLGQIDTATKGTARWSYLYDEGGQRIAKLGADGNAIAVYVDDSYIDATSMTAPLRAGGAIVGVVRHTNGAKGTFVAVPTDARGTALADADGTLRMASPFGDRAAHPDVAAAVDYAAKGWDADLGVVRMGMRDYDPAVGRWMQPDPLYFAEPARIVKRPVDGALYAYAMNDPVAMVDPAGTQESRAADNYIAWRNQQLAAGNKQLVADTDAFRAKGALASAAAGVAVTVAANAAAVGAAYTEASIQTWGAVQRLGTFGRAALVGVGLLKENQAVKEEVKQVVTAATPQVEATGQAAAQSTALQKYWPPDMGFSGPATPNTLSPGTVIDRFGGEYGKFTSPVGTPFPMRALPPQSALDEYHVYEVLKPLDVLSGTVAPAFGYIGQGIQHLLPAGVKTLIEQGFLKRIQ